MRTATKHPQQNQNCPRQYSSTRSRSQSTMLLFERFCFLNPSSHSIDAHSHTYIHTYIDTQTPTRMYIFLAAVMAHIGEASRSLIRGQGLDAAQKQPAPTHVTNMCTHARSACCCWRSRHQSSSSPCSWLPPSSHSLSSSQYSSLPSSSHSLSSSTSSACGNHALVHAHVSASSSRSRSRS